VRTPDCIGFPVVLSTEQRKLFGFFWDLLSERGEGGYQTKDHAAGPRVMLPLKGNTADPTVRLHFCQVFPVFRLIFQII
jgi:hypothetical protein